MADSELSQYYEAFVARLAVGEGLAPEDCACRGGGWILSQIDTWHQCPDHYTGQRHPEDDMDEPATSGEAVPPAAPLDEGDVPF